MASRLVTIGAALSDETRAGILCALMDGRSRTGGELARFTGVAPSTASEHLSKLLDARLVAVQAQGRHRYFRIAGPEVAQMLESLGAAAPPTEFETRAPAALLYARSCYHHLAGQLAVEIFDQLIADDHLSHVDGHLHLTESGRSLFTCLGVDVEAARHKKRPLVRGCLDWTQRRHHLAGTVGTALLAICFEKTWLVRGSRPRSVELTDNGRIGLLSDLGVTAP